MSHLRALPQVDKLAKSERLRGYSATVRIEAARRVISKARIAAKSGTVQSPNWEELAAEEAHNLCRPSLSAAINATGVLLHTGLGRARLAPEAASSARTAGSAACTLEIDVETGKRGDRVAHVRSLLCELTGAEDAHVVNNCAAAVMLALAALASEGETILSRGQMVEIGGSFRLPEIVQCSGSKLVEVGCTNRTRLSDYAAAVTSDTRAILRCHPSNFKMVGFVEEPSAASLAGLCRERGIALIDDVGSGCLVDLNRWGLPHERTLQEAVSDGATVVTASGDKLLGGPQAGLILGNADAIAKIKTHPMARAMRIDKLCLAALESTLLMYRGRETEIPTLKAIARSLDTVRRSARRIAAALPDSVVQLAKTALGGGSVPGEGVPTYRVGIATGDPDSLAAALRQADPPIFGRIEDGRLWLDPRPLEAPEVAYVVRTLRGLL